MGVLLSRNSLHEIREHKELILEKSGMTEQEYSEIIDNLLSYIKMVPHEHVVLHLEAANRELGHIDIDDVVFLATSMAIPNSIIWSNDTDFEEQNKIRILKTKDILELFSH